jgi:dihydroorotase
LVGRDLALLEEVGGRLHIAHVSCAETVALLRAAKERGLPVTAEVTPHHLRLTDRLLAGNDGLPPAHPCTKVNPPLRSPQDVEALVAALADGTIDAVATDHAPHTAADKAGPFQTAAFGFSAIETALPLLLDLARDGAVDLPTLIARLTCDPARVFGLDAGTLQPGHPADICIFDPDSRWTVSADALWSKGKNTPLLGAELRGRVTCTIVGGEVRPTL